MARLLVPVASLTYAYDIAPPILSRSTLLQGSLLASMLASGFLIASILAFGAGWLLRYFGFELATQE